VRIVAVASFLIGGAVAGKVYSSSQCQGKFSERATALAPALTKERDTQRAADEAEGALWLAVKPGDQTPEQKQLLQRLFTAYQATIAARHDALVEADKARAAHPLPDCSPQ